MRALVVKELRQLAPIAWLWLAVLAIGYLARFFTERIDEQTFSGWCEGFCEPGTNALVGAFLILFAMVTAYGLFPREHDESTIDFLRALPVPRRRIYLSKVVAAWLMLCGVTLASYAIDAALLASNPETLGGRFVAQVWWTLLWRDCVFAFVILAHGVVLSWFRTTGLIVYALYVLLLMWYEGTSGSAGLLSVFGMLANEYEGQRLVVDVRAILVHVGVACALLVLGHRLWSRTESGARAGGSAPSRGQAALRGAFAVLGFATLSALLLYRVVAGNGSVPDEELAIATTEHYRFVHRPRDASIVDYVLEHAEADLAGVARMLGVEELPLIRVDLTASSEHAAGLAKWKKIRMDLTSFEDDISQRRVLAHEATHVLQAIESNRALARHFATTRFFIEGMAQHVSFAVVPEPRRRASNHALAAVAKVRQDIRFEDLIDGAAFGRRFDPELYYSLGDLWSLALTNTCGEAVLGDFLRAAGRDGASREIGGERFWRDTFRETGCELDAVNSAWAERMDTAFAALDERRFPVFDDIVVTRDTDAGVVRVEARLRAASTDEAPVETAPVDALSREGIVRPGRVVIRVRDDERLSAGVDPVFPGTLEADEGGYRASFAVPLRAVPRARFRYQLGYRPGGAPDSRIYHEGWRAGRAD